MQRLRDLWDTIKHTSVQAIEFPEGEGYLKYLKRGLLCDPVAKTLFSQCKGPGFDPLSGNKILHSATKSLHAATKDTPCASED